MHSYLTPLHSDFYSYYTSETALFKNTENIFVSKPEVTLHSLSYLTFLQHLILFLLEIPIFLGFCNTTVLFHRQWLFIFYGLIFNLNSDGKKGFILKPILSSLNILMTNYHLSADGNNIPRLYLIPDFQISISNYLMDNFHLTGASN